MSRAPSLTHQQVSTNIVFDFPLYLDISTTCGLPSHLAVKHLENYAVNMQMDHQERFDYISGTRRVNGFYCRLKSSVNVRGRTRLPIGLKC